jgi:predicted nucleotidyltransferase
MHNELLKNISAYFSYERKVIAVYLFGSYAEGNERPLSDIDIGILLDRTDHNAIKEIRNKCIVELSRILWSDNG